MQALVAVVDDDVSIRESLQSLIRSAGFNVQVFDSAEQFLSSPHLRQTTCLVADVRMPGMNGPELHQCLLAKGYKVPVIFITAHASDEETRERALSDGAVAYLIKPFEEAELLDAVHKGLRSNSQQER
jgi:FixJ family two-component response regulator